MSYRNGLKIYRKIFINDSAKPPKATMLGTKRNTTA